MMPFKTNIFKKIVDVIDINLKDVKKSTRSKLLPELWMKTVILWRYRTKTSFALKRGCATCTTKKMCPTWEEKYWNTEILNAVKPIQNFVTNKRGLFSGLSTKLSVFLSLLVEIADSVQHISVLTALSFSLVLDSIAPGPFTGDTGNCFPECAKREREGEIRLSEIGIYLACGQRPTSKRERNTRGYMVI